MSKMNVQCTSCKHQQSIYIGKSQAIAMWVCDECGHGVQTDVKACLASDINKIAVKDFRPKHYEKGHDTFAWSEHKFDLETNLAICQFNIHKYNDREKGQNKEDFEKIIVYAQRALDLIKEDKMEVTGL